jgi:hypothetical protein
VFKTIGPPQAAGSYIGFPDARAQRSKTKLHSSKS